MLTTAGLSRNTLALLISNVGSAVLSFLLSVIIGRALGEDGLGVYAAALAWVFPLSLAAEFGLGTLITRDVAQDPEAASAYLQATTVARLWLGGALTVLLVVLAPFLSDHPAVVRGLQLSAPLIVILPLFGSFTALFRARQVMWPIPWLNLGMLIAQVVVTALVLLNGGDVIAALVVNAGTSAGQLAGAWAIYRWKFHGEGERRALPLQTRDLLRRALPFAIAAILAALQTRLSAILLERLASTSEVGYYAAASRFVEAGRMIPNAFFGALFPTLAALALRPEELHRAFTRTMWGLLAFGVVLGMAFTLLASPLVNLTFGAAFTPSIIVLQLLMWSLLPGLLRAGRTLYWYALGREEFVNLVTAVTLLLQVTLNLWLIPQQGALGAAGSMVVVEVAALVLLWRPLSLACYARR
jgi:O-antigen/teichoic acid export membrane protein